MVLSPPTGYLCVHVEKDECLGSTLILTWVPNSRIQRQDEEALRYITPESSPVHRNARRRGRRYEGGHQSSTEYSISGYFIWNINKHQIIFCFIYFELTILYRPRSRPPAAAPEEEEDEERNITSSTSTQSLVGESSSDPSSHQQQQQQLLLTAEEGDEGSCELSDEVSRDSTMGSDSDTFSSPFCLSPVSEALCESSGSVFLDTESRSVRETTWVLRCFFCTCCYGCTIHVAKKYLAATACASFPF